jgi:solute carrier family 25 oxoglutarate transporter 11
MGWIVVHPFNTAAIRMNLAIGNSTTSQSFLSFIKTTLKDGKSMSLYDGLSAGILRQTIYATARFGLFEVFRDEIAKYRPTDIWSRLSTGLASGAVAAGISCPAEVTLVRLSNDATLPIEKRRGYTGVFNAFTRILSEEGPMAFTSGCKPFISRAMLVGMVQVGTNDQFKATYRSFGITNQFSNVFCAAMSSGLIYSIITMPFETSKNRMAFQKIDPITNKLPYTGVIQTISKISTESGVLSLWNGFQPYYLRCGGHTVLMFLSIEFLRKELTKLNKEK